MTTEYEVFRQNDSGERCRPITDDTCEGTVKLGVHAWIGSFPTEDIDQYGIKMGSSNYRYRDQSS